MRHTARTPPSAFVAVVGVSRVAKLESSVIHIVRRKLCRALETSLFEFGSYLHCVSCLANSAI